MNSDFQEIDEGTDYVGYREAFDLISANARTVGMEELPLAMSVGRIAARDIIAAVSYPSSDVSFWVSLDGGSGRRMKRWQPALIPWRRSSPF